MRDNREDLTLPASIYWNCAFGCAVWRVTAPRWLWPPEELAALSEGVGSSSASGVIILWKFDALWEHPLGKGEATCHSSWLYSFIHRRYVEGYYKSSSRHVYAEGW